jgi:hypothetical protein
MPLRGSLSSLLLCCLPEKERVAVDGEPPCTLGWVFARRRKKRADQAAVIAELAADAMRHRFRAVGTLGGLMGGSPPRSPLGERKSKPLPKSPRGDLDALRAKAAASAKEGALHQRV